MKTQNTREQERQERENELHKTRLVLVLHDWLRSLRGFFIQSESEEKQLKKQFRIPFDTQLINQSPLHMNKDNKGTAGTFLFSSLCKSYRFSIVLRNDLHWVGKI